MNRIILFPEEKDGVNTALLQGERARHVMDVLGAVSGRIIQAGWWNGASGEARVLACGENVVRLETSGLQGACLAPEMEINLVVALPRPQTVKKVLEAAATFGVRRLVFTPAKRVEKNYFQSPVLYPDAIKKHVLLGLMQGGWTRAPEVTVAETEMDEARGARFVLHPAATHGFEKENFSGEGSVTLAIGPEGGWLPDEMEKWVGRGWQPLWLGASCLRVEQAVVAGLAQLELMRRL